VPECSLVVNRLVLLAFLAFMLFSGCGGGAVEDNGGYKAGVSALTDPGADVKEAESAQREALLELSGCFRKSGATIETYQENAARADALDTNEIGSFARYGEREARQYASFSFGDPGAPSFTWTSSNLSGDQLTVAKDCVAEFVAVLG
jgi:hypothetical protein